MIRLPITDNAIAWARMKTTLFDTQKTHDKLACKTNYIGLLGEKLFSDYLHKIGVTHDWHEFIKPDYDEADYNIQGESVDIKTTFDTKMWIQRADHDIYIFTRVNQDLTELFIIAYITKKELQGLMDKGKLDVVERDGRQDYTVKIKQLHPIEELIKRWET